MIQQTTTATLLKHARRTVVQLEKASKRRNDYELKRFERDLLTSAYNVLNIPDADRQVYGTSSSRALMPLPKEFALDAFGKEVRIGDIVIAMRGYQSKRLVKVKVARITECFFICNDRYYHCG